MSTLNSFSERMNRLLFFFFHILLFLFAFRFLKPSIIFSLMVMLMIWIAYAAKIYPIPKHRDFLFLCLTFISYFFIDQIHHGAFDLVYLLSQAFHLLSMPLAYWMGWMLIHAQPSDNKDATFQRTIYLVAGGGATYAFLSHMKKLLFPDLYYLAFSASDFSKLGIESHVAKRSVMDLWNNNIIVATEYNMHYLYLIALIPLIFFSDKRNIRLYLTFSAILTIWATYITGSRSNVMLILLSILFGLWYKKYRDTLHTNLLKSNSEIVGNSHLRILISILAIFVVIAGLVVAIDASNILDQSLMFKQKGFGIQEILYDPRWTFAFEVLKNLRYQPFGNMVIDWAHNVWLDVAHEVGIIPMIFLLIFSFHNIKLVKTIWLKFEWKSTSRLIALSTIFLINISFFLEPVIKGSTQHFLFYSLIIGMLNGYIEATAKSEEHCKQDV